MQPQQLSTAGRCYKGKEEECLQFKIRRLRALACRMLLPPPVYKFNCANASRYVCIMEHFENIVSWLRNVLIKIWYSNLIDLNNQVEFKTCSI